MEEKRRVNGFGLNPERRSSDWGHITLLDKTKEFFQTCDVEGKGFITRTDMRVRERSVCVFVCVSSWQGVRRDGGTEVKRTCVKAAQLVLQAIQFISRDRIYVYLSLFQTCNLHQSSIT